MNQKTHGIVFRSRGGKITVSCQCRASYEKHTREKGGGEYYEPMPRTGRESVWETYNRPDNHWVEFTDKDKVGI